MRIAIICTDDFIAENLRVHVEQAGGHDIVQVGAGSGDGDLAALVADADAVVYQVYIDRAGEARTGIPDAAAHSEALFDAIDQAVARGRRPALIYISSGHAASNADGAVEDAGNIHAAALRVRSLARDHGLAAHAILLPQVFGKWCPPGGGSVVASLCDDVARGLPIRTDEPGAIIRLVYIDDVAAAIMGALTGAAPMAMQPIPEYRTSLGDIAALIGAFRDSRRTHVVERVGTGLTRALYSTYLSYLDPVDFSYPIASHGDARGVFSEMLRTKDSGQISFFTAGPGVTRGGHYHHSKTEKFLVIRGRARFRFRQIVTGQQHELAVDDVHLRIVETVPGWTHDITNIGDGEMLVMLWANEQFDPAHPDTYASAL